MSNYSPIYALCATVWIIAAACSSPDSAHAQHYPHQGLMPAYAGMGGEGPDDGYAGPGQCGMCGGQGCSACCGDECGADHESGYDRPHDGDLDQVGSFIDCPIPMTQIKVRYDRARNFQDFDRALYFFPTTINNGGQLPAPENVLHLEDITTIIEVAFTRRVSAFVELPGRLVESDPPQAANGGANRDGFGDLRAGGKFAIIANDCEYLTAQVRVYMPTGDAEEALGTGHTSIEAGLLYQNEFASRWNFTAEVLDWQAINSPTIPGTDNRFTSNVIQYGVGISYDVLDHCGDCCNARISAVAEFIGWTVIEGFKSGPQRAVSADEDTIVNGYYGLRATWGAHTFYGGYGSCLTNDQWYEEIYRLEYAWRF